MTEKEKTELIWAEAHLWATTVAKRMDELPVLRPFFGTILAYAVEVLLGIPFDHKGKEYDQTSKDFAKFLQTVHEDVKKNVAVMKDVLNKKAN